MKTKELIESARPGKAGDLRKDTPNWSQLCNNRAHAKTNQDSRDAGTSLG